MIRIAAVDTSTWWGGAALVQAEGGRSEVVAEIGLRVRDSHAAHLLALLDRLLEEAGWSRSGVDVWVATRGPGSFTGLRIALGTVAGLGLSSGRPCLGVGTLEALAEAHGPAEGERVPLLDAGRGEVYGARYDAGSSPPREIVSPWLGPREGALAGGVGVPVLLGPAAAPLPGARVSGRQVRGVAAAAASLAAVRVGAGAADGDGMSPLYLRPPDAELPTRR